MVFCSLICLLKPRVRARTQDFKTHSSFRWTIHDSCDFFLFKLGLCENCGGAGAFDFLQSLSSFVSFARTISTSTAEPKRWIFSWQAICRLDFSCKWYNRLEFQSKNWMRMLHTIRFRPQFPISLYVGCTLRKSVAQNFLHADWKFAVRYCRRPPFSHISRQTRARFSAYIIFCLGFHSQSVSHFPIGDGCHERFIENIIAIRFAPEKMKK